MSSTGCSIRGSLSRSFPELATLDEARRTLTWFEVRATEAGLDDDWLVIHRRMNDLNIRPDLVRSLYLKHDFWLCKRANPEAKPEDDILKIINGEVPWHEYRWQPPDHWRCWPTFGIESEDWLNEQDTIQTRSLNSASFPIWNGDAQTERASGAKIQLRLPRHSDLGAIAYEQVVAWVDIAIGRLGRYLWEGVCDIDPRILVTDLATQVISEHSFMIADMMEDSLQILYGSALNSNGRGISSNPSSRGQSFEWRDYFRALGKNLSRAQTLEVVQLAALLLRSESVWSALSRTREVAQQLVNESSKDKNHMNARERSGNDALEVIMCVRRRWYLALRSLAWLEIALQREQPFEFLRPNDFTCFAITSLLPTYPRPLVAVSHRSCDVKEQFISSKAWRCNEVLIDATFRPEWQTNLAMVWSLFSATPVICKVRSEKYADSNWCQREAEMFKYLCEQADFLEGRYFFEVELSDLKSIEQAARSSPDTHRQLEAASGIDSPPFELIRWPAWQGVFLRASAVAKFVYRLVVLGTPGDQSVELSNSFLETLTDKSHTVIDQSLLGFERIWHHLSKSLINDSKTIDLKSPLVTVKVFDHELERERHTYLKAEAEVWFRQHETIMPNPVGTDLDVCDLLAALEWCDHLENYLVSHNENSPAYRNQAAFIDLRGVTLDEWTNDPGWTVARGLIYLRRPYPLVLRQLAGQSIEHWPVIRDLDLPIFTQHVPDQLVPQSEIFFSLRGSWPAIYLDTISPALAVHPDIHQACHLASKKDPDPVYVRTDKGLNNLFESSNSTRFKEWLSNYQNKN